MIAQAEWHAEIVTVPQLCAAALFAVVRLFSARCCTRRRSLAWKITTTRRNRIAIVSTISSMYLISLSSPRSFASHFKYISLLWPCASSTIHMVAGWRVAAVVIEAWLSCWRSTSHWNENKSYFIFIFFLNLFGQSLILFQPISYFSFSLTHSRLSSPSISAAWTLLEEITW